MAGEPRAPFRLDDAPFAAALAAAKATIDPGSPIDRLAVYAVAPPSDPTDDDAFAAVVDALLTAAELRPFRSPDVRQWAVTDRAGATKLLLYPLRFSMAYGSASAPQVEPSRRLAELFLAPFGPQARFVTNTRGLAELLDEDGAVRARSWGYGSRDPLTAATFELALIAFDGARAGLFVATDED